MEVTAQELSELLDHSSEIVYVVDMESYELLYANKAAKAWKGNGALTGRPCYEAMNKLDERCPWCFVPKMVDGRVHFDEAHVPDTDMWLRIDCHEIDWQGRRAAAVFTQDISKMKQQQVDLEIDRDTLDTIINNLPVGIGVRFVRDGKVVSDVLNSRIRYLLDLSAADLADDDRAMFANVEEDDREALLAELDKVLVPDGKATATIRYHRDGEEEPRWYRIIARSIERVDELMVFTCIIDVSASRRAEMEKEKIRLMYEAAVEDAKLILWEYDISNHRVIVTKNDFASNDLRQFRMPKIVEDVPNSIVPYVDEKYVDDFLGMYRKIEAGEPKATCEVWYKQKSGQSPRCERISYTTVFDKSGKPVSAMGIGQNITALRLEQINFNRSLQQLLDGASDTLCSFRLNLTKNMCESGHSTSPFIQEMLSAKTADKLFDNIASIIADPQDKAAFRKTCNREALSEAFRNGQANVSIKYRRRMEDGAVHWVTTRINMVRNPYSSDIEAVASSVDNEDAAIDELIVRRITNDNCDFIGTVNVKNRTFRIRNSSAWAKDFLGNYPTRYDECLAYDIEHFVAPEDAERYGVEMAIDHLIDGLKSGEERFVNFRCVCDGVITQKSVRYGYLYGRKSDILMIQTDVTAANAEQQRQMERLGEALAAAKAADAAKSDFLSRMSHDIRTPLNGIIGMTHIAQECEPTPEIADSLEKIETSSNFLLGLVNDILDMSKAESGKMELHPEPYLMSSFNDYIDSVIKPLYEERNQTFVVETHPVPSVIPIVDILRFNQIMFNLLSNAVKYTPEGGTISLFVQNDLVEGHKERITAVIRDNGIGMSKQFQDSLFDPFTQENRRDVSESKGSGLGLAIAKKMVDLMGGTISVESELGQGTTFTVTIDFDYIEADQAEWAANRERRRVDYGALEGKHILLCEDHPLNQEIAVHMLEKEKMAVTVAEDGQMGLREFAVSPTGYYDAILMDVRMPVMNGLDATRAIRALDRKDAKTVPIIAMTADAYSEDIRECLNAGMNAHVPKPVDADTLMAELAGHCTGQK